MTFTLRFPFWAGDRELLEELLCQFRKNRRAQSRQVRFGKGWGSWGNTCRVPGQRNKKDILKSGRHCRGAVAERTREVKTPPWEEGWSLKARPGSGSPPAVTAGVPGRRRPEAGSCLPTASCPPGPLSTPISGACPHPKHPSSPALLSLSPRGSASTTQLPCSSAAGRLRPPPSAQSETILGSAGVRLAEPGWPRPPR